MNFSFFSLVLVLLPLAIAEVDLVVCPDKVSACPDGTTCCPLGEGTYGCCPIPNAVCCQDQRHCCPHDSVCDVSAGQCKQHSTGKIFTLHKKTPARRIDFDEDDDSSEGQGVPIVWNSNADTNEDSMKLEYPQPNVSPRREPFRSRATNDVECADGKSKCPSGTTCCSLGSGIYGCCPVPDAVCCEDHLHCCPAGSTCDTAEGRCVNSETDESTPWYRKFSSTRIVRKAGVEMVPSTRECQTEFCQGDETCCSASHSRSAPECCPFTDGVCCHGSKNQCCPKGYRCHRDGCVADSYGITVTAPSAVLRRGKVVLDAELDEDTVRCPDDSFCGEDNTCCPVPKDREDAPTTYQCCPLKYATCCDQVCCPRGYHCASGNRCEKAALSRELLKLLFN